jgi:hypothetical protein
VKNIPERIDEMWENLEKMNRVVAEADIPNESAFLVGAILTTTGARSNLGVSWADNEC